MSILAITDPTDNPTGSTPAGAGRAPGADAPEGGSPATADDPSTAPSAPTRPIEVVIVDDEPALRLVLRATLERDGRFAVAAEAGDGREAIEVVRAHQPDVVLLDLLMPVLGGIEALPQLLAASPRTMVLVLSALSAADEAPTSFAAGAFAYFEKSLLSPRLGEEIHVQYERFLRALAGETVWAADAPWRIRR